MIRELIQESGTGPDTNLLSTEYLYKNKIIEQKQNSRLSRMCPKH